MQNGAELRVRCPSNAIGTLPRRSLPHAVDLKRESAEQLMRGSHAQLCSVPNLAFCSAAAMFWRGELSARLLSPDPELFRRQAGLRMPNGRTQNAERRTPNAEWS
jgi:hypothetical protein